MNRREFVFAASGVAGAAGAATAGPPAVAQEDGNGDDGNASDDGNQTDGGGEDGGNESAGNETDGGGAGGGGGGGTEEVVVGPGGEYEFDPEELTIEPGTTVLWTWDSDNHNVAVEEQPDDAEWEGHEPLENTGFEYEHTFEVEGEYHYVCTPHEANGMVGDVIVQEGGGGDGGGGGGHGEEVDIHDLGVPIQKHFVGIASLLAIFVSLVFTFYLLKYGESANTSSPGRR